MAHVEEIVHNAIDEAGRSGDMPGEMDLQFTRPRGTRLTLDAPLAIFQSKTRPSDSITVLVPIRDENGGVSSAAAINYRAQDTQRMGQL